MIIVWNGTLKDILKSGLVESGSIIQLRQGNYTVGDLECTLDGVTITNYPGEQATIVPASGYRALLVSGDNNTIDGLIIDGTNVSNEALKVTGVGNVIVNCEVKNAARHGILVSGDTSATEIDTCHVHHCGTDGLDHGIYISGVDGCNVHDNEVDNIVGHAIHVYGTGAGYTCTVDGNNCHDCADTGIGAYYGIVTITGNTIARCGGLLIRLQYQIESATVTGNDVSFPTDTWTCFYVADLHFENTAIVITGNTVHDADYGLWVRNQGAAGCSVTWQSNTLTDVDTATLVQDTNIELIT